MNRIILLVTIFILGLVLISERAAIGKYFDGVTGSSVEQAITYEEARAEAYRRIADETEEELPVVVEPVNEGLIVFESDSTSAPTMPEEDGAVEESTIELSSVDPINLRVPFQPQAPYANWALPYAEACEEASIIMVDYYLRGQELSSEKMDVEINEMVNWQAENGYAVDASIREMKEIADHFYNYRTRIVDDLSPEKIIAELMNGNPVIVPVRGQALGNPYFTPPGPLYHVLVIKGVTEDGKFITNDPGTRRGADLVYDPDVLMNALADWDGSGPYNQARALILEL